MEFALLERQLKGDHNTVLVLKKMIEGAANVLDDYWRTEPDIENACASAVFDARRYHRSTVNARKSLQDAVEFFAGGIEGAKFDLDDEIERGEHDRIVATIDMMRESLRFIEEQCSARRDRKAEPKPEEKQ